MPPIEVTVVVPTLGKDDSWRRCLHALDAQTFREFEVIVVDNSGSGKVQGVRVIANARNVGFGEAINQGIRASTAPYVAALNDDALASPQWLEKLVGCAKTHPQAGMFASEVHLGSSGKLDSAGMLIASDGSSKQRGHGRSPEEFAEKSDALFPSGSAALYRRTMLDEIGLFDESYFLYCEDTDLGLRGRWAGWDCRYVPGAIVEHAYSQSAGRASVQKAYLVERNRIATVIKNFPSPLRALLTSPIRYLWHVAALFTGKGKTAEFTESGTSGLLLPWLVVRAHLSVIASFTRIRAARRLKVRKISAAEFTSLLDRHSISLREVASL